MSKNKILIICVILAILLAVFIILGAIFSNSCMLFNYNLMDILTVVAVSFVILFLTIFTDDRRKKNEKVEDVIGLLQQKLHKVFDNKPIEVDKHSEYLYSFKYIDNKIRVLEELSKYLSCNDEIKGIKSEKQKLDDFITENICQGNTYFTGDAVKDKIPNILCNIDTHLDNIILNIYNTK